MKQTCHFAVSLGAKDTVSTDRRKRAGGSGKPFVAIPVSLEGLPQSHSGMPHPCPRAHSVNQRAVKGSNSFYTDKIKIKFPGRPRFIAVSLC